jgi:WD40 repeat protein/energy-coupling factor transporter ATP-binding protein EcfA2
VINETPFNPFPGLRPFRTAERYLFFGREGQSEAILGYLREHHFVALVGSSGSGKSSLINAGLLPYLYGGFLAEAGSNWRVAICRPGTDPIGNLASVLCMPDVLGEANPSETKRTDEAVLMEVTLRGSSVGLIDAIQLARMPSNTRLVLIVDQFEELFRFAGVGSSQQGEDAAAFVNLLLEAQSRPNLPIYLVLAMRSDYIGDCARFRGLPEAIMSAIYLIPRMTRDQRRQAIEGPVGVGEGTIALRLINRLLNDVGDKPDQLPSMQHALMRTWEYWQVHRTGESPIDLDDYNAVGGLAKALSNHADDAFNKLPDDESRRIARLAFQTLTGKDVNSREARHPATVETIAAVAKVDPEAVIKVINHFREPERAFLTPVWGIDISGQSIIDISHESLIRGWDSLRNWVLEEAESAKIYLRLAEAAALHAEGKAGLWRDPELQLALDWYNKARPTEAWASRYDPGFERAVAFLDASREERDAKLRAQKRATQLRFVGVAVTACIITVLALLFRQTMQGADAARSEKQKTKNAYLAQVAAEWTRAGATGAAVPLALEIFLDGAKEKGNPSFPQGERALENALRHLHERLVLAASPKENPHQRPDPVLSAAFSKDGRYIVTASMDGVARLWDASTGQPLGIEMRTDGSSINDVSFSPAGDRILTVTDDGATRFWNASNGEKIETPPSPEHGSVSSASYSLDGRRVLTSHEDGAACVWETTTYTSACTSATMTGLRSAAFSPDGSKFAAGSSDGAISIWRTDTLTPVESAMPMRHGREVTGIGYTPDGKSIVTTSSDRTWAVWNSETGANLHSINATTSLNGLAIGSDGARMVTASVDNIAQVWDIASGKAVGDPFVSEIAPSGLEMRRVAFSPDMKRVLTASGDGTARLWDIEIEINVPVRLEGHGGPVHSATFSPDGSRVVTSSDNTARVFDAVKGNMLAEFSFGKIAVLDATFSPDGKFIVVALGDGSASVLRMTDGQSVGTVKITDKGAMNAAVFSQDGKKIAVAYENGSAWVWDLQSRTKVGPLGADARGARSAVFSRDGSRILTAHRDGTARVWNSNSGAPIAQTPPGSAKALRRASYNNDETLIITASADGTARIWDARNQTLVVDFSEGSKILYNALFSPDGRRVLTASQDQGARLSDASTGEPITRLFGNNDVLNVTFSPDGKKVATASVDGIARVWSVFQNTDALVNYAKTIAPRCLSSDERKAVALLPPQQDRWCDDMRKWWYTDQTNE